MKRFIKRNSLNIFVCFCILIITFEIILSHAKSEFKTERVVGNASTYSFWNIVAPSEETIEKVHDLKNILPINYELIEKESNEEDSKNIVFIKSYILDIIKKLKAR